MKFIKVNDFVIIPHEKLKCLREHALREFNAQLGSLTLIEKAYVLETSTAIHKHN